MSNIKVTIDTYSIAHTLPDIWTPADLRQLLALIDWEDIDELQDADLLEMTLMALQDIEHQHAGEHVLEQVFGKSMSPGVRQNLVDDLQDDEPWQDFSVVAQQHGIFVAVVLMHQAFPNRYPNPDTVKLRASFSTPVDALSNAAALRLLSAGMNDSDVLMRLYEEELESGKFDDADGIIWHRTAVSENSLELMSSVQWFGSLRQGMSFQAKLKS